MEVSSYWGRPLYKLVLEKENIFHLGNKQALLFWTNLTWVKFWLFYEKLNVDMTLQSQLILFLNALHVHWLCSLLLRTQRCNQFHSSVFQTPLITFRVQCYCSLCLPLLDEGGVHPGGVPSKALRSCHTVAMYIWCVFNVWNLDILWYMFDILSQFGQSINRLKGFLY